MSLFLDNIRSLRVNKKISQEKLAESLLITRGGMVYKRLNKNKKNTLVLESDNQFYPNYEVKASDILEIWEYECNIGRSDRKQEVSETTGVKEMFLELKRDISAVKESIKQ